MLREKSRKNRVAMAAALLAFAAAAALPCMAAAETVLRIGMTAADIPRTLGQPDQGFEGNRFTGLTMYDALAMWDLSSADKASAVIPGLANGRSMTPITRSGRSSCDLASNSTTAATSTRMPWCGTSRRC